MNRLLALVIATFSALVLAPFLATASGSPHSQSHASVASMESAAEGGDAHPRAASSPPSSPRPCELGGQPRDARDRGAVWIPPNYPRKLKMYSENEWKARKAERLARQNAIVLAVHQENRTFTPDENVELQEIAGDLANIEKHLSQLAIMDFGDGNRLDVARPRGVAAAPAMSSPAILSHTRAQLNGDKFKGETLMRVIRQKALGAARNLDLSVFTAQEVKRGRPDVANFMRIWNANEIPGGGEKTGEWGSELVHSNQFVGDFIELLRERTVFDQLGLREVPANISIKGQDGTGTAYWVGEGKAIPMSTNDFSSVNLAPLKVGALTAISLELLEDSSPSALQLVQESLIADSAQLIDSRFFSATAASAGVSPAGIVNGVAGTASAGTDQNGLITDADLLTQAFITNKNTGGLKFVSRPALAQKVAGFVSFAGTPVYPGLSEIGGVFQNKPWLTSDNVVSGDLLLIKPTDIFRIGDQGLSVDISRDASLEFASDPTGSALANGGVPVAASKQVVNLFASGMIGVRLLRRINWAKRRASAVARITGAAYVPAVQTA